MDGLAHTRFGGGAAAYKGGAEVQLDAIRWPARAAALQLRHVHLNPAL